MDREINLLNYLPSVMQEFKEFKVLAEAENPEVSALWSVLEDIMNDQFINDSTENGVKRWETILKIIPKGTDSLDVRKFRILTRLNEKLPYTFTALEQQLVTLCGADRFSLELNNGTYTLTVRVELAAKGKFDEVNELLKRTVPANIVIDLSLLYNQQSVLSGFTHGQLSAYTHNQLRIEVIN
jgi:hypothetical protein